MTARHVADGASEDRRAAGGEGRYIVRGVEQGWIQGISYPTYSMFASAPYAAPPIGAGRFQAPEPHAPWRGIRDATRCGATSPQPPRGQFGALDISPYFEPGWVAGDDYLTVDVWTPPEDFRPEPAPVLVFLHGGAFIAGSSHSSLLDGRRFAENGIVVVTVNYRLGIAGFLDIPGAFPNRGLADALAALAWVNRNIDALGGDPNHVTVAGHSAGAMLIAAAIAAPDGNGLFHRAIMQSGSGTSAFTREQAAIVRTAAAQALQVPPTLDDFAKLTDEELVAVTPTLMGLDLDTATARDPLQKVTPFGTVLDEQPASTVARGVTQPVDLLIGHNSEEGNLYLVPDGSITATTPVDLHAAAAYAHPDADRLLAVYSVIHGDATPGELRSIILGETVFGAGTRELADRHAAAGHRTYAYVFDWRSSALAGRLGATHIVEIPFVFDNLLPSLHGDGRLLGAIPAPQSLADGMHRAWIEFMVAGSPGWLPYERKKRATMRIGDEWILSEDPYRKERTAWI